MQKLEGGCEGRTCPEYGGWLLGFHNPIMHAPRLAAIHQDTCEWKRVTFDLILTTWRVQKNKGQRQSDLTHIMALDLIQ